MSIDKISKTLKLKFPAHLVDVLLETYQEQKRNFYLGNLRPNEVEGGRFSEAAFRMLEHVTTGTFTAIGSPLDTEAIIRRLQKLSVGSFSDSIRLHIPRMLRVVYDIRNKRDAAHLADGIDPNLQDSCFVFSALDWVLAEFIRITGSIPPDEAYALVREVIVQAIPVIEDFDGFLKTLKPSLKVSDRVLVLLYHQGTLGASDAQLSTWLKPSQRKNLNRTLTQMVLEKDLLVQVGGLYKITRRGIQEVQKRKLLEP